MDPEKKDRLYRFFEHYEYNSPEKIQIEGDRGGFYPKEIAEPDIAIVPLAEPHVIITDLYDDPQDWYNIRELIEEFAYQAYTCYYRGLYIACFLCSINCIELTLKYEFIRNLKDSEELEKSYFTFGKIINKAVLEKIHLKKYNNALNILNLIRIGLIHFNPKKLREATKIILDESEQFYHVPINNLEDWSRFACFSYTVMWQITSELYGESKRLIYLKEGLEDYRNKKQLRRGRHEI